MVVTLEKNKTVALNIKNIRVNFNIRYGWGDKILAAYQTGIEELKQSIRTWGYKANEPLEVYDSGEVDELGDTIFYIAEGHRRFQAASEVLAENPEASLGEGLLPGEVWSFITQKPENILKALASQFDANKSQSNTRLDIAKAVFTAFTDSSIPGNKTQKLELIGSEFGGITRQACQTYINVYELPDEVKDWIQISELSPEDVPVTLSFGTAGDLTNYYKVKDASKLFTEALERVNKSPESVKTYGKSITKEWLHELAVELKLGKAPKKEEKIEIKPESNQEPATEVTTVTTNLDFSQPDVTTTQSGTNTEHVTDLSNPATERPEKSEKPATPSTAVKTPAAHSQPKTPIERIEALLLESLKKEIGFFIATGKADVTSGKFIVEKFELPIDRGETIAELLAAYIDPASNPVSDLSNPVTVVEEVEF